MTNTERGLDDPARLRLQRIEADFDAFVDMLEDEPELSAERARYVKAKYNDSIGLLREVKSQAISLHAINPRPGFDLDELKAEIDDVIDAVASKKAELRVEKMRNEPSPRPAAAPKSLSSARLAQHKALFDLRESGILTKREFDAARRRLAKKAESSD